MLSKIFRNKNLKNGGLYLFGNLFNKAISFITVPIFTRILSTEEYGIASTYSSWVAILAVIVGLSLGNSIRNAYVDYKDELGQYILSVFSLSFINFLVIILLAIGIDFHFRMISMSLLIMCFIHSFGSFLVNSMVIKYMIEEESFKRTILLVCPNFFAAILSVIMILNMNNHKEYGRIIPMFLTVTIFGLVIFIKAILKGRKIVNREYWKYALSISVPLIFHGLSVNILSTSDRTIITAFRSASETGVYSVVYNFGMLSTVVTTSIESVWIPYFTKKMIAGEKKVINRSAKLYIELCTIIFCGMLIVSPEALVLFASEKYRSGIYIIAPVILASYFQYLYSLAVNTEFYYKQAKIIASNTIIAAVVNLVLNFIFIPLGGAIAAAFTTVVAYCVSFVLHYRYCKKIDKDLFPLSTFSIPLAVLIFLTFFQYATLNLPLLRWGIGLVLIVVYLLYMLKNEGSNLKKMFSIGGKEK